MTTEQFNAYQDWVKRLSDRELSSLWATYCAPTENENAISDADRALLIHNEMTDRALLPTQSIQSYSDFIDA
jgi:hypothetical protein